MISGLALVPLASIVAGAIVILLLEAIFREAVRDILGYASLAFLVACGVLSLRTWGRGYSYFGGRLSLDNLSLLLTFLLVLSVFFVILMSFKYFGLRGFPVAESYALLLLALSGAMVMVSTSNLLIVFLGLEVLSVASYALAGLHPRDPKSPEAAAKYFLLGSFASAVLVLGLALTYGAAGSLEIRNFAPALAAQSGTGFLGLAGLALVLAAFAFKIALVPFHMWTPDVYEGAPTPAAAFFAVGPKIAGFAVLIRLCSSMTPSSDASRRLVLVLGALAVLTMVAGNLAALRQTNIKRLLAYSSIAHAGYAAVGLAAGDYASVVFYLAAYLFMTLGAFAAVTAMSGEAAELVELGDYAGIGFKYPWLGATFSIFLLSLAGFPPLAGFLGKYYIFTAAVRQGFVGLAVVGVLATLVSVYFYFRVIVFMYMREPASDESISQENPSLFLVLFLCLYGVLQLGLNPGNILALIRQAVSALFRV